MAVNLSERTFVLASTDDPDREAVAAELAPLLLQIGRPKDAERVAREVLTRGPRSVHEVVLRRVLGEVLWAIGWLEPAVAELEAVAGVPGASDRDQAGSLALAGNIRMLVGDLLSEARGDIGQARALLRMPGSWPLPCGSACPTGSWDPTWSAWRCWRATSSERRTWLTR